MTKPAVPEALRTDSASGIAPATPYRIVPVQTPAQNRQFIDVAKELYSQDPNWVAPLDAELTRIFQPEHNKAFHTGEAMRWLLLDAQGQLCGRIAAFFQRSKADRNERPVGAFGFFECVNDPKAAHLLLDTARQWLEGKGMAAMEGPANFGENDRYSGLLVEGFTQQAFGMNYNPPFYSSLLEGYGLQRYYDQVSMHLDNAKEFSERYQKVYEWVSRKTGVKFDHATRKNFDYYVRCFQTIYNEAWAHHRHFTPLTDEQAQALAKDLKQIMLEKLMIFSHVGDEPAGMLLTLPDLNQIFKPLNGRFPLWKQLLFLLRSRNNYAWYRKKGILTRGRTIIVGVRPRFQKYGLDVGMVGYAFPITRELGLTEIELGWVGDWNPLSRALQSGTGASPGKVHRTYRIHFDGSEVAPMTSVSG